MIRLDVRRRALLKALGVGAGCLPLLRESRASAATPKHLLCAVQVGGYVQSNWKPAVGPLVGPLPSSCSPLEAHKGDVIFLPDLTCPAAPPVEPPYSAMFCAEMASGGPLGPRSITVDQIAGAALGTNGLPASLALGAQLDLPPLDGGNLGDPVAFFTSSRVAVEPRVDPYATYANLFGGLASPTATQRVLMQRRSILDFVGKSLDQFRVLVGTEYRAVVDRHLELVREVENQLQATSGALTSSCSGTLPSPPLDIKSAANYSQVLDLQMNLAVIALACGVTPVATVQLCDSEAGNVQFTFNGLPATWRQIARDPNGVARKQSIDLFCMQKLAALLDRLAGTSDGVSTLLDSTVVLWANDMDDGRSRNGQKLPWILATRAGGYFKTGQCAPSAGKPVLGVLAEVCNSLGVSNHPFGPPMPGLH